MPDAQGNFKSAFYALSDERWALIFGPSPNQPNTEDVQVEPEEQASE